MVLGDDFDDFVVLESAGYFENIATHIASKFKVKVAASGQNDRNELRVFNLGIQWTRLGIVFYDCDHRHVVKLTDEVGLMP